jgi:glycosyltransferase involved in cell wall biosynthesis
MSIASEPPTVLSVFATFAVGGPQVRFAALANRLGRSVRHVIVAMDGNTACAERLDPGLDVRFPKVAIRPGTIVANFSPFRAFIRATAPAVLLTHNWGSMEWAIAQLFTGTRHIHVADGFGPEERSVQLRRRVWTRRLALRGSTVIVPSRTLEHIARDIWRLADVRYVPNGIDLNRLAAQSRGETDVPVIGTVAALRPEKNLGRLLRACALLTVPYRLVIVGDGPERAGLQALAGELGIGDRVQFPGHVADPAPLYAGFDLVAMSSDTEQMPLCVLEAMGAGLPVAATDVGDIAAMVAPDGRRFVVGLDTAALAGALGELLTDAGLRGRLGAANRTRAEAEFDQETMFARWKTLLLG